MSIFLQISTIIWFRIFFVSLFVLIFLIAFRFYSYKKHQKKADSWKNPKNESESHEDVSKNSLNNSENQKGEGSTSVKIKEKRLPKGLFANIERAEKLIEHKKYEEATRLLISVLAYDEDHPDANAHLAYAYLQMNDFSRAEGFFRQAVKFRPDDPILLTNFAIALFEQKTPSAIAESLEALEKAAQIDERNPERHANFGQSLFFAGRLENALSAFVTAVNLAPRRLEFLFFLGDTYLALQKYSEAKEVFEKILHISPKNAEAQNELEKLLLKMGEVQKEEIE